jgi:hypothetical protein
MNSFVIKPGETVVGLGFDFANRLAAGETLLSVDILPDPGLTVNSSSVTGTIAVASISVSAPHPDAELALEFTVTGTAGSVRKGTRMIQIKNKGT